MLATSSSDEEDSNYRNDTKKKSAPPSQASKPFMFAQQQQQSTPQMRRNQNAMQNMHLTNGGSHQNNDNASARSSFSASSENVSLNNFQQPPNQRAVGGRMLPANPMLSNPQMRQASFKSTTSTSRSVSKTLNSNNNNLSPGKNSSQARSKPRRPGDNVSFGSSINDRTGGYDSDNSDYQYEEHYGKQASGNQYVQASDEEDENEAASRSTMMGENEDNYGKKNFQRN